MINRRARFVFSAALIFLASSAAHSACPVPNVLPFQDGCPLHATPLNNAINSRMAPDASNVSNPVTARANFSAMAQDGSDAALPMARTNLLYTPQSCSGFRAADGEVTGTAFHSATASFTSGDVGKPISIRKAGTKFFVDIVTISAGGTGFTSGDLVNFASGVQAYVGRSDLGVASRVILSNKGSVPAISDTITQTSSVKSGSLLASPAAGGSGLVLTPTWVRENHVTTIASVQGPNDVTLALGAAAVVTGATWGYSTDDTAVIQAAASSGDGQLPPGICGHTSTITMLENNTLIGEGKHITTLMYLGAPNSPQIFMGTQAGERQSFIQTGKFTLDGLGAASKGYVGRGVTSATVYPTYFTDHTTIGHDFAGNDAGIASINNVIHNLEFEYSTGDLSTVCIAWGFPNTYDISADHPLSSYGHAQCKTKTTTPGFLCGASDHNTFGYIQTRAGTEGSIPGIETFGSNWAVGGHCRTTQFIGMDSGEGGLYARGKGFRRKSGLVGDFYDRGNGSPAWVKDVCGANFTASISSTTLTVSALASGEVEVGCYLDGGDVLGSTMIIRRLTGLGGTGTYEVDTSQTLSSTALTLYGGVLVNARNSNGVFEDLKLICQPFAEISTPKQPASIACIDDALVKSPGSEITVGGGAFRVLAGYTGTANKYRIIAALESPQILFDPRAKPSGYAVLAADSGAHFNNTGAVGTANFTLPTAFAGGNYCFFHTVSGQTMQITATGNTTITIGASVSANNGNVTATALYSSLCIEAHGANRWMTRSVVPTAATWTVN